MNTKEKYGCTSIEPRYSPRSATNCESWSRRGERYALAILERGGTAATILSSLGVGLQTTEGNFADVLRMFADPRETAERASAEREFRSGAIRIAVAAGALAPVEQFGAVERARA